MGTPSEVNASSEVMIARMLLDGQWRQSDRQYEITDPYRGGVASRAPVSSATDLDDALNAAVAAKNSMAAMPGYQRAELLHRAATLVAARADEIAVVMAREAGKPISDGRTEVSRAAETLKLSAEEAVRIQGAHVPLDASAKGAGKLAMLLRFPVGVVAAITPYNAPINLTCHKIGPAIAAGNAVVLKAPIQAPATISRLSELLVQAGLPAGAVNVLYGQEVGPLLVRDSRVDFISFTGSDRVGRDIRATSGLRRVALELGGVGATIVHADARVDKSAPLCAMNAMRLAGQSCISVQNVFVHASLFEVFTAAIVESVSSLKLGDPLAETTEIGPMVDEAAARRVEKSIENAVAAGARLLCGGRRHGAAVEPAVFVDAAHSLPIVCEEIFGPVVSLHSYEDVEEAFRIINSSRYGLQCGIFTDSVDVALRAVRALRFGGVIINGTSTWRTDQLPYGGVKDSGIGREGPRYAIREMTEERLVVFDM